MFCGMLWPGTRSVTLMLGLVSIGILEMRSPFNQQRFVGGNCRGEVDLRAGEGFVNGED